MDRPRVYGNFINGAWTEGAGDYANTNPSDTRDVIGRYARATKAQAADAIGAAQAAARAKPMYRVVVRMPDGTLQYRDLEKPEFRPGDHVLLTNAGDIVPD